MAEALTCVNGPSSAFEVFNCSVDESGQTVNLTVSTKGGGDVIFTLDPDDLNLQWKLRYRATNLNPLTGNRGIWTSIYLSGFLVPCPPPPGQYCNDEVSDDIQVCDFGRACPMKAFQLGSIVQTVNSVFGGSINWEFHQTEVGFIPTVVGGTCDSYVSSCVTSDPSPLSSSTLCCTTGSLNDLISPGETVELETFFISGSATEIRCPIRHNDCELSNESDELDDCPTIGAWAWTHRP